MTANRSIIYTYLLDEGVDIWRPTQGEMVSEMIFRVLPIKNYYPVDEYWEFTPGTIIRCEKKLLSGGEFLVAIEKV